MSKLGRDGLSGTPDPGSFSPGSGGWQALQRQPHAAPEIVPVLTVAAFLDDLHYLGSTSRGLAWSDEFGVLVLGKPTSRRLPQDGTWLELSRWCLVGTRNGGSRQFARVARWLRDEHPGVTTLVSYSDPSQGHTGALYKACNWLWAPTWHRLRPPPSGNGSWSKGKPEAAKDRWVYPLGADSRRAELLRVKDDSLIRRDPTVGYREPRRYDLAVTKSGGAG